MGYGLRFNLGPQQPEEGYSNFLLGSPVSTFIEYLDTRHHFLGTDARFCLWLFALVPCFSNATARLRYGAIGVSFQPSRLGTFGLVGSTLTLCGRPVGHLTRTRVAFALSDLRDGLLSCSAYTGGIAPYRGALAKRSHIGALLRTEGIAWALPHCSAGHRHPTDERGRSSKRPVAVYVAIVGTAFSVYFAWRATPST